ncbi:MAG: NERD domain-containing protein [Anaerolineae bacterium]|nr:NERD domain-containing protein [Anaerolineae bacterium]
MRVVTNTKLAKRNRQIAQYGFFASFLIPIGGLLLMNQETAVPSSDNLLVGLIVPFLVLPLAYVLIILSVRMSNLWVREPRPETVIEAGLKGISNKSVLYNYFFFPARHVLFTPQGVFAMTTRFQDGSYTVNGTKWVTNKSLIGRLLGLLRMDMIGDPTRDAERAAERVQKILADIAPDVTVQPLIVFVDPRVQIQVTDSPVPILHANPKMAQSLKDYMKDITKQKLTGLTQEQIEAFEQANLAG